MIVNMKAIKGGEPTASDAEVCAYLYTASLTAPMDHDWSQIYLYVATKTYRSWEKGAMPADVAVDSLSEHLTRELDRLKGWLYRQRTRARMAGDQAERRHRREEAETKQKAEQPALFDF